MGEELWWLIEGKAFDLYVKRKISHHGEPMKFFCFFSFKERGI